MPRNTKEPVDITKVASRADVVTLGTTIGALGFALDGLTVRCGCPATWYLADFNQVHVRFVNQALQSHRRACLKRVES